jgi:hypothetical protein
MPRYISSRDNRFYVRREDNFAVAAPVTAQNRFPAVRLVVRSEVDAPRRRDKTGTRTFLGHHPDLRRNHTFELKTYQTSWPTDLDAPSYGPLFEAAMGGVVKTFAGGRVARVTAGVGIEFETAVNLTEGQAVVYGSEMRFVTGVVNERTVELNAPFSLQPAAGSQFTRTVTFFLGTDPPSISLYDYWAPSGAVSRLLYGSAVDDFSVTINGDYHEFTFRGFAAGLTDSSSFSGQVAGLSEFPPEPVVEPSQYQVIPGHLGQAWIGNIAERYCTLTSAEVRLRNNLDTRNREFGCASFRGLVAGERMVTVDFALYETDEDRVRALYESAALRSPIGMMFQLGGAGGQLFGLYAKAVLPELPEFDDSEPRLVWEFRGCRAQGSADDELVIAFG